jgi:hypothetical protein
VADVGFGGREKLIGVLDARDRLEAGAGLT